MIEEVTNEYEMLLKQNTQTPINAKNTGDKYFVVKDKSREALKEYFLTA